ncbi:MAG: hypothetical protein RLZZ156_2390 [Deinococcota bacterium]|jgi:parvulin-like peptidyl-prolyl isomerase
MRNRAVVSKLKWSLVIGLFGFALAQDTTQSVFFVNGLMVSRQEINQEIQMSTYFKYLGKPPQNIPKLLQLDFHLQAEQSLLRSKSALADAQAIEVSDGDIQKAFEAAQKLDPRPEELGFTVDSYRSYLKDSLHIERRGQEIVKSVVVTPEEVKLLYATQCNKYSPEDKVVARMIVGTDRKLPAVILAKLRQKVDFTLLARQYSLGTQKRDGALGAKPNENIPQPLPRREIKRAFPEEVENAMFDMVNGGVTDVIWVGSQFYIAQILKYLPAQEPSLEANLKAVEVAALKLKKLQMQEMWFQSQIQQAKVTFPQNSEQQDLYSPMVAQVNGYGISLAKLNAQALQNVLRLEDSDKAYNDNKKRALPPLIEDAVVFTAAQATKLPFIGLDYHIQDAMKAYIGCQTQVSEADVKADYLQNKKSYVLPARGFLKFFNFNNEQKAIRFRKAVLSLGDFPTDHGAQFYMQRKIVDLSSIRPGIQMKDLTALPTRVGGLITAVVGYTDLSGQKAFDVAVLYDYVPQKQRSLEVMRPIIQKKLLGQTQARAIKRWIESSRKNTRVEIMLDEVLLELSKRTKK